MEAAGCALCDGPGGRVIFTGPRFRVVHAHEETGFPAFYRLVWTPHVREFSDLDRADRALCMDAVAIIETTLREHLRPDKINLAALGNMVPHLHWHVIARFTWDSRFPAPVWAAPSRAAPPQDIARIAALLPALETQLASRLAGASADRTGS